MPRPSLDAHPETARDIEAAIDDLLGRPKQAANRMDALADLCIAILEADGLPRAAGGSRGEVTVPGFGRPKDWDVSVGAGGRPRLLLSLKSILENLVGTVPNRGDDLMGEVANIQHRYPEVVTGYVIVVNHGAEVSRTQGGERIRVVPEAQNRQYIQDFRERLVRIAIRRAPVWGAGLIEGFWVIEVDSRRPPGSRVVDLSRALAEGEAFFRAIVAELDHREPALRSGGLVRG